MNADFPKLAWLETCCLRWSVFPFWDNFIQPHAFKVRSRYVHKKRPPTDQKRRAYLNTVRVRQADGDRREWGAHQWPVVCARIGLVVHQVPPSFVETAYAHLLGGKWVGGKKKEQYKYMLVVRFNKMCIFYKLITFKLNYIYICGYNTKRLLIY